MSKIVLIIGPTASGKTKLSIKLAKYLNAEVINADAVSIYKNVNIGSAKVTEEEMEGIPHHLIDKVELGSDYTIFNYQRDGRIILDKLIGENKNIVIVGGSGLYVKALLYDYKLVTEEKFDKSIYEDFSNEELKKRIDKIYIENEIHINNRKRLIRFLSHYDKTGLIIKTSEEKDKPLYDFVTISLVPKKEELNSYINKRVDIMFDNGLLDEAKRLFNEGKKTDFIIGYKELNKYFRKEISLNEAKELIKLNTRKFAKRQLTWNRHQFDNTNEIEVDYENFSEVIKKAKEVVK